MVGIDQNAMEDWEHELTYPHDDEGPPRKRRRIGDYEPERYSPTSPE